MLNRNIFYEEQNSSSSSQEIETVAKKELNIILKLKHPNVVTFLGHGTKDYHIYIVMELMEMSLENLLLNVDEKLNWKQSLKLMKDVLNGIDYLHSLNILHRDIKPANVLVLKINEEWICKICDFGLSGMMKNTIREQTTVLGTLCYTSPEVLHGELYTCASDLFSFSITSWIILMRTTPYSRYQNPITIGYLVCEENLRPGFKRGFPNEMKELLESIWNIKTRINMKNIKSSLKDIEENNEVERIGNLFLEEQDIIKRKKKVNIIENSVIINHHLIEPAKNRVSRCE
jgi:serine/threonine protein kinase